MTEKELFLEIIKDSDVSAIFEVIGEKSKSKNQAYRKQKLKKMLMTTANNGGSKKRSVWELLCEDFVLPEYEQFTINEMLKQFIVNEPYVPMSVRFFTLKYYQPEFFEQHFEKMVKNVQDGQYFLTDLIQFETDEAVEAYWKKYLPFISRTGGLQFLIDSMYNWVEQHLTEGSNEWVPMVTGITIKEFEAISPKEDNLGFETFVALITFLKYGQVSIDIKASLLFALQYDFTQAIQGLTDKVFSHMEGVLQSERQTFQQKQKEMKKELRSFEQRTKKSEAEMRKLEAKSLAKVEQAMEETRTLKVKYEKENHLLTKEVERLNGVVKERQQLTDFFKRGIKQKYHHLKWVICHSIPLMFAQDIFPEFEFVRVDDLDTLKSKEMTFLWIQQSGVPYAQKRALLSEAQKRQISVKEFQAKEERELIMELSIALKEFEALTVNQL